MAVPSLPVIRHGCLLHSLAGADPRLQLLSNGATWYPVLGTKFSSVCSSDENKTTRKLKGEVYLTRKFRIYGTCIKVFHLLHVCGGLDDIFSLV